MVVVDLSGFHYYTQTMMSIYINENIQQFGKDENFIKYPLVQEYI